MHRFFALALASLPTVCSGSSTNVEIIDLSEAGPEDGGIDDASAYDSGWLGAACNPASDPSSCDSALGLSCGSQHTNLPEDVYGTCVFACGTPIEASQCAAWGGKCAGDADSGADFPLLGYCILSDF
ncbi:MAG: hypothetical protein ACLQVI_35690 [Polyangiaceae bacterium]|jgi:hypothetical protein